MLLLASLRRCVDRTSFQISKKGTLLPAEFLADVQPNPFNTPPEQNLYGKIPPSIFNVPQFQKTTSTRIDQPSTKFTQVKVEEFDEEKRTLVHNENLYPRWNEVRSRPTDPSPTQHRSGPRKSEPLVDGLRSMTLNEPNTPGSSRDKRKSRYSEPLTAFGGELNVYSILCLKY